MTVALLVITDGRDEYLNRCTESMRPALTYVADPPITEKWMYDDTGDEAYRRALTDRYPQFTHINGGGRQGFGGAISAAWQHLAERSQARYVLHVEADFVFTRPVDLHDLAAVLDDRPYLAQMALRRQAWNTAEKAAGGVVEQHPGDYVETVWRDHRWLQHTRFFTTNVSLYRRDLCRAGWPEGGESEGRFGIQLRAHGLPWGISGEAVRFGFWGAREDPPWTRHIGEVRAGTGY